MVKIILLLLVIGLASLGLTEFMYGLRASSMFPKADNVFSVVVLCEESATEQLDYLMFNRRWFGNSQTALTVAVTDNLSDETLKRCYEKTKDTDVVLVPCEYLKNVMNSVCGMENHGK